MSEIEKEKVMEDVVVVTHCTESHLALVSEQSRLSSWEGKVETLRRFAQLNWRLSGER